MNRVLVSDLAYDGFERLTRRNISGLAVVNDDGHTLFGNLSGSDIKNLGSPPLPSGNRTPGEQPCSSFFENSSFLRASLSPIHLALPSFPSNWGMKFL